MSKGSFSQFSKTYPTLTYEMLLSPSQQNLKANKKYCGSVNLSLAVYHAKSKHEQQDHFWSDCTCCPVFHMLICL